MHAAHATTCPTTGARLGATYTVVNEDEVLVGSVVGDRYVLRDLLGQGTTGTVFAAEHAHFGRPAAMKVLRARYSPLEHVQRVFHGEARAAWTVTHPCLCEVFDIGQLPDGAPFFVMERLEGETLAARLGRERMSLAAAVDVLMQLLSAIDAIHARDLLLRDLRPQNVFLVHRLGCRPLVKILDFGLARLIPLEKVQEEWDSLRAVVGASDGAGSLAVPYYLSPERTRGEHGVEPASDLFVAAVIFYEALTGRKPFTSTSFNGLLLHISQASPPPLADLRPDVPPALDDLVTRALAPSPRQRPASARAMQEELRAAFEGNKRPSTPMRAPLASEITVDRQPRATDPAVFLLPEEGELAAAPPEVEDAYDDETRTDRKLVEFEEALASARSSDRTLLRQAPAGRFDEASADNPSRTVRPPSAVEILIDVAEPEDTGTTSRGADLERALLRAQAAAPEGEEEETETMELSPEMRARIEAMAGGRVEPPPPATRKLKPQG